MFVRGRCPLGPREVAQLDARFRPAHGDVLVLHLYFQFQDGVGAARVGVGSRCGYKAILEGLLQQLSFNSSSVLGVNELRSGTSVLLSATSRTESGPAPLTPQKVKHRSRCTLRNRRLGR